MGHPWPLFHLPFQTTLQFLQQINVKKCPFSIQCWYSNPQPSEHESPPITTRLSYFNVSKNFKKNKVFLFQNSENFFFCVPFISFLPLSLSLSLSLSFGLLHNERLSTLHNRTISISR